MFCKESNKLAWYFLDMLAFAVPTKDGYVTVRNCPVCGCTPGQNDVITMDELENDLGRSLGSNYEEMFAQITQKFNAVKKE